MASTDLPHITYSPQAWAQITARQCGPWEGLAWFAAAAYCDQARENESPVLSIWDAEEWWEQAETQLALAILSVRGVSA